MKFIYNQWHNDVYIAIAYNTHGSKISLYVFAKCDIKKKLRIELGMPKWYFTTKRWIKNSFGKYNIKHIFWKNTSIIDLELEKRNAGDYFAYIEYEINPSNLTWLFIGSSFLNPLLAIISVIENIEIRKIEIYDENTEMPATSFFDNIYTGIAETLSGIPKGITNALFMLIILFGIYIVLQLTKKK